MAALAKLQGQGWWAGNGIWGTVAAGEFRLFDLTWLAAYPTLILSSAPTPAWRSS